MRLPGYFFSRKAAGAAGVLLLLLIAFMVWFFFIRIPPSPLALAIWELTLADYAGNTIELSEYKKEPTIFTVWGSWCPFCDPELAVLSAAAVGKEVQVVAINRAEPDSVAKDHLDHMAKKDNIMFLKDPQDAFYKAIGGYAMPETIFIDKHGQVFIHQHGPFEKPTEINARYVEFLAAQEQ